MEGFEIYLEEGHPFRGRKLEKMKKFLEKLKISSFDDISLALALYRPGPMDQIPRYIKGKQNPGHNEYTHPSLEPILNVTYGCMVYQEQVMQIVRDLAGYSLRKSRFSKTCNGKEKTRCNGKRKRKFYTWAS